MISKELKTEIVEKILRKASPKKIVIFGSLIRDDVSQSSDIDIAVFGIKDRRILADLRGILNEELATLRDVDVVFFDILENEDLKQRILKNGVAIYERDFER